MISEIEKRYINRLELKTKLYPPLHDPVLAELDKKKNAIEKLKEIDAILKKEGWFDEQLKHVNAVFEQRLKEVEL